VLALGPKVRVNAICPGPVLKPPTYSDERWENLRNLNPLHEIGTAEQVGETVLFLVTGPHFINGDCIMLDGGRMWKREF
jgi:NAD(P)-dependent dehydrogenase (short-subunit alcohol dehydrogenase family)